MCVLLCLSKGRRGVSTDVPVKGEEGVVCTLVPIKEEEGVVCTLVPIKGEEGVLVLMCLSKGRRGCVYSCAYQRGGGGVCTERMRGVAINEDKYALPGVEILFLSHLHTVKVTYWAYLHPNCTCTLGTTQHLLNASSIFNPAQPGMKF